MHNNYNEIKEYYEEWWESPLDPRDFVFKKLNKVILERLPQGEGKRALDVGSGKGTIVSFLLQKGYQVVAVELNENFAKNLKRRFPEVKVIEGDFNSVSIGDYFDIVTAIEFIQNLDKEALSKFFSKVAQLTDRLMINISNKNSLHGFWTSVRNFQKPFVHTYTPNEIERMLGANGLRVTYKCGIGFLTPITLLSNFRFKIIPIWLAKVFNNVGDLIFPKICHLFYLEVKNKQREIKL